MARSSIVSGLCILAAIVSANATDLATIIKKVSVNCDKITSYFAEARVRYHI